MPFPKLAPIQAVIVPIYKNDAEKSKVMEVADKVLFELKAAGIRIKMDDRERAELRFQVQRLGSCAASSAGARSDQGCRKGLGRAGKT